MSGIYGGVQPEKELEDIWRNFRVSQEFNSSSGGLHGILGEMSPVYLGPTTKGSTIYGGNGKSSSSGFTSLGLYSKGSSSMENYSGMGKGYGSSTLSALSAYSGGKSSPGSYSGRSSSSSSSGGGK